MNHCAAVEMLGVYALHACDARERTDVEQHLLVCAVCAAEVERLVEVVWRLDEAMRMDRPPDGN